MKYLLGLYVLIFIHCTCAHAEVKKEDYDDCNWLVSYRGKVYDLAPLTRETLNRPLETDMRPILEKVPEAGEHLNRMTRNLRDAKSSTIIASAFITSFIITRIMAPNQKNEDRRNEINLISLFTGGFFLKSTYESWNYTREAKLELVRAVNSFNDKSPHKIEPAQSGINLEGNHAKTY